MIVYKYVVADRVDVLVNGNIRFTQPGALNDPFEAMPCLTEYKTQVIETLCKKMGRTFDGLKDHDRALMHAGWNQATQEIPNLIGSSFAFLSLTKQRNNLLMWSHYTDAHKGFVLGMDSDSPFFQPGPGRGRDGLREVVYSKTRYVLWAEGLVGLSDPDMNQANTDYFFTKSPEWSYEEELRLIAHPPKADAIIAVPGGWDILLYKFPPECIREIILGYRMEKPRREKIVEVMRRKYPHAEIFEAVLSETEFAVEIMPFKPD